jgi:methyl-accepting chemotaxis protein
MSKVGQQVAKGVAGMGSPITPLAGLDNSARRALASLTELTAATRGQTLASQNISLNIENIARMADGNGAAGQRSAVAAHNFSRLAADLMAAVRHFKINS